MGIFVVTALVAAAADTAYLDTFYGAEKPSWRSFVALDEAAARVQRVERVAFRPRRLPQALAEAARVRRQRSRPQSLQQPTRSVGGGRYREARCFAKG